ncbi:Carbonic anhydrase 2 [Lamellibrachia satsuma]|nr:Carbonic anhydrase 2 [Lamellibrachia satsuma]
MKRRNLSSLSNRYSNLRNRFLSLRDHWSGAAKWFKLNGNEACLQHHQSPINIEVSKAKHDGSLGAFTMDGYDKKQGSLFLENNGHSAQVHTLDAHWTVSGGSLTDTYRLLQFHFHWGSESKTGSEHTIDSKQYPLEMHMVHMSTKYNNLDNSVLEEKYSLTVLGIMFEVGSADNGAFQELTDQLRTVTYKGKNVTLSTSAIRSLMPSKLADYYTYEGSLTTPPCSEVVIWNIFRETVKISERQLKAFRSLKSFRQVDEVTGGNELVEGFMYDNYRPLQPLNGRVVRKNFDAEKIQKQHSNNANVVGACLAVLLASFLGSIAHLL